jgi:hypothetical protein
MNEKDDRPRLGLIDVGFLIHPLSIAHSMVGQVAPID